MADKPTADMNALLRGARGVELPEPKTKRERKKQNQEMNALLRAARGFTVEATTEEGTTDA
jgi:ribosomal protein L13E